MGYKLYFRHGFWDFLLCAIASCALTYNICGGFYAARPLQGMPQLVAVILVCAVVSLYLFAVSYNSQTILLGSLAFAVISVIALAASAAASSADWVLCDQAGNYLICALILILVPLVCFLLGRRRLLCVLLLALGIVSFGLLEYLYWQHYYAAFAVFAIAAAALFVYRTYQRSLLNSDSSQLSFGTVSIAGIVAGAFSIAVAMGVFMALIAPLNPPNVVLKLFTEHYSIETEEVRGVSDTAEVAAPDIYSNTLSQLTQKGNQQQNNQAGQEQEQQAQEQKDNQDNDNGSNQGLDQNDGNAGNAITSSKFVLPAVLVAVLIAILVVCGVVFGKRRARARWWAKLQEKSVAERTRCFYMFLIKRLKRIGLELPAGITVAEFAKNNEEQFRDFEKTQGEPSRFSQVTDIFQKAAYGNDAIAEEDFEVCQGYYSDFYRWMRAKVGTFKYCLMFLFI